MFTEFYTTIVNFADAIKQYLDILIPLLTIIIIGGLFSVLLRLIVYYILRLINFDLLCDRLNISKILQKSEIKTLPILFVSNAVFIAGILFTLLFAFQSLAIMNSNYFLNLIFDFTLKILYIFILFYLSFLLAYIIERIIYLFLPSTAGLMFKSFIKIFIRTIYCIFVLYYAFKILNLPQMILNSFFISFFKYLPLLIFIPSGFICYYALKQLYIYLKAVNVYKIGSRINYENNEYIVKKINFNNIEFISKKGYVKIPIEKILKKQIEIIE